jgi:hypothetical protein
MAASRIGFGKEMALDIPSFQGTKSDGMSEWHPFYTSGRYIHHDHQQSSCESAVTMWSLDSSVKALPHHDIAGDRWLSDISPMHPYAEFLLLPLEVSDDESWRHMG